MKQEADDIPTREEVDAMVAGGAVFSVMHLTPPFLQLLLATARWYEDPQRLRWVSVFPTGQNHCHEIEFTHLSREADGQGVGIFQDDEQVGAIHPIAEVRGLDPDEAMVTWRAWQRYLEERPDADEQLAEFIGEAI